MINNICPVCGYQLPWPPEDFHICPSCGTEFGYDDAGRTHAELRAQWIERGAHWWSRSTPAPVGWDPLVQLVTLEVASIQWQKALYASSDYQQMPARHPLQSDNGSPSPMGLSGGRGQRTVENGISGTRDSLAA